MSIGYIFFYQIEHDGGGKIAKYNTYDKIEENYIYELSNTSKKL